MSVSKSLAVAPSNAIDLPWPIKILEPKIVKPVVDSMLFEPAGFNVVTPADKGPITFKLSFISIWVESVERITLPATSIVPKVCVVPEPVIFTPEILPDDVIAPEPKVPVVDKFSSPNEIEPPESVIEPFVNAKLPAFTVGAVTEVVIETTFGKPIVNVSVATYNSFNFIWST